jgi:hypothetical protein
MARSKESKIDRRSVLRSGSVNSLGVPPAGLRYPETRQDPARSGCRLGSLKPIAADVLILAVPLPFEELGIKSVDILVR